MCLCMQVEHVQHPKIEPAKSDNNKGVYCALRTSTFPWAVAQYEARLEWDRMTVWWLSQMHDRSWPSHCNEARSEVPLISSSRPLTHIVEIACTSFSTNTMSSHAGGRVRLPLHHTRVNASTMIQEAERVSLIEIALTWQNERAETSASFHILPPLLGESGSTIEWVNF